jgi:hypothetical protein
VVRRTVAGRAAAARGVPAVVQSYLSTAAKWGIGQLDALTRPVPSRNDWGVRNIRVRIRPFCTL